MGQRSAHDPHRPDRQEPSGDDHGDGEGGRQVVAAQLSAGAAFESLQFRAQPHSYKGGNGGIGGSIAFFTRPLAYSKSGLRS